MTFHFAWVAPTETVFGPEHQREDEAVFAFRLEHAEGDFATLEIDIRNPRRRFLADATDIWAWLSEDLGSGTSLIAAESTGRSCLGLELDPAYVDVIVERWQRFTGGTARLDGEETSFAERRAAP